MSVFRIKSKFIKSLQFQINQYVSDLIKKLISMSDTLRIKNLLFLLIAIFSYIPLCMTIRSPYNPISMDYELRRPITWLYNRLAYKFDVNPYTSHLVSTQTQCSSKTGPFCGFLNKKQLMQNRLKLRDQTKPMHVALTMGAPSSRDVAFQIEKGLLDVFLISSQTHKTYDQIVRQIIEKDFYSANPSHEQSYYVNEVAQKVGAPQ